MSLDDVLLVSPLIYFNINIDQWPSHGILIRFVHEVSRFVTRLLKRSLKRGGQVAKSSDKIAKLVAQQEELPTFLQSSPPTLIKDNLIS